MEESAVRKITQEVNYVSRSHKYRPFDSWCSSKSMKAWRTKENQRLRHNAKQLINNCEDYDALVIPVLNDYDTLWGSPQDGRKHWQERPALNQCEVDAQKYNMMGKYYHTEIKDGHHPHCSCYGNKRGWYWKMLRK